MALDHILIEVIGYGGTALTVASYAMRTIIPLRIAAILASLLFIIYGFIIGSWPVIITEAMLVPLNVIRLVQVIRLIRQIDEAADTKEMSPEWLKPFGRRSRIAAGAVVFSAGDAAHDLLVIESGRFELKEISVPLEAGAMVGELGFLSPGNRRTMTLVCVEEGVVSRVTYSHIKQLYFSNPKFAFYFLRLVSDRLFQNLDRAEKARAAA